MKKIIICFFAAALLSSCDNDGVTDVSSVTNYAELSFTGERIIVLTEGDTFTDPGATALAGEQELEVSTSGSVDTSTPGVYKLTYQALNDEGFASSIIRTVIVLSSEPSAINLEGTFQRSGNINNVTRLGDRVYVCDNATGYITTGDEAEDNITLTFYNIDDEHIYAPFTQNASPSGISAESNLGNIYSQDHWDWVIIASAVFGTAVRDFNRI